MTEKSLTIAGESFTVNLPYAEGHTLTAVEAKALNQTRCENIRNNLAKQVKDLKEAGNFDQAAFQKVVSEYDSNYTFATPSAGGGRKTMDPVEKEARKLAREMIKAALERQGTKIGDVDKDALAAKIDEVADMPDVVKEAKAVVAKRTKLAELDLGL